MIVSEPPPSIFLAAPKKRFGFCNALASTPPVSTFPLAGATVLYALARRVIESRNITTSCPHSTSLFAFSSTSPAIFTCRSAGSSNVEAITSAFTVRAISVTSSGRSSISNIIIYASGWLAAIALAISFISIVLPVLGCATMSERCPFPIGENRSTIRVDKFVVFGSPQRLKRSSGNNGVRFSKDIRSRTSRGLRPLTFRILLIVKYFSPLWGGRILHSTTSPVLREYCLICCTVRCTSSGEDR